MEMSLNRIPSLLLPSLLLVLFLPIHVASTIEPTPISAAASQITNRTLLFETSATGNSLRNCSCSTHIQDCNEALANLLCSCRTVLRSALPPAGLRQPGGLTVWIREIWVLQELVNMSTIGDLHLSFCGTSPPKSQYLAVLGLQTLRIHSSIIGVPFPDQDITVMPRGGSVRERGFHSSDSMDTGPISSPSSPQSLSFILHVTFLDVAVLNGLSTLKAYSVVGPSVESLSNHFPYLSLPTSTLQDGPVDPNEEGPVSQDCLLTFIY